MVKNKPKLAYCHLKSSNGQCRIDCPFLEWRMPDISRRRAAIPQPIRRV